MINLKSLAVIFSEIFPKKHFVAAEADIDDSIAKNEHDFSIPVMGCSSLQ